MHEVQFTLCKVVFALISTKQYYYNTKLIVELMLKHTNAFCLMLKPALHTPTHFHVRQRKQRTTRLKKMFSTVKAEGIAADCSNPQLLLVTPSEGTKRWLSVWM